LARAGVGFCFAPRFHAAMRFAAAPRREIGIRTMLNLLGPLANPAGAAVQLVGVFAAAWTEPLATALGRLGATRAFVVHGGEGLDEISAACATRVSEWAAGAVRTYEVTPATFGLRADAAPPPRVADADASAAVIQGVLAGESGPARDLTLVNAAAVLVVAGVATDWRDGFGRARAAITAGAGARALESLVAASQEWHDPTAVPER
jgi:anthranilate phosphoribosyltransferase